MLKSTLESEIEPSESGQKKLMGTSRAHLLGSNDRDFDSRSRISNASGAADEAELVSLPRMLMDTTGRLLYVGESASLSYLQLIRMIVESVDGTSDFTTDPERHKILENTIQLPHDTRPTGLLPDRKTADILIDSFFTNTSGFVEVFNKKDFLHEVEACYYDPLNATQPVLCRLNLVFAIGLVIARPVHGSDEAVMIDTMYSEPVNRAELFFRNATNLYDPVSGFEDADFWSVQALLLMSVYMLAVSKRNASYVYYGMAVRSAFALGLHREESMVIFNESVRKLRRNVWRTLFVLDRFLAACLGRPITISEEDCSEHALAPPIAPRTDESAMDDDMHRTNSAALDAAVRSCYLIGLTIKKVYSKRKVSTLVAQEIADRLENWERELDQKLHCQRIVEEPVDTVQAVAILHINLLHCHSVLLLTRPFFLYLLKMGCDEMSRKSEKAPHVSQRLEKFSQACVEASQRTIILARVALDAEYLPQCNPFIIYFVFAAALIVLSNEFALLYHNPDAEHSIHSALSILAYCGQRDVQAKRVSYILESFHNANMKRHSENKKPQPGRETNKIHLPGRKIPTISTQSYSFPHSPVSPFFRHIKTERPDIFMSDLSPTKERQLINVAVGPSEAKMHPMMPPTLQQPSPEGSVSLNSGIAAASMAPGMEALSGSDPEFDFDSLWQGWNPVSAGGMGGIPPSLHPAEAFGGGYGPIHQPPMPQGNGLNHHHGLSSYPPSDYR
ncbi:fungal-specific transcription factor domain-containing protein [Hypoxylon sp. NC1633]|nr:fungal-specific transcription factor domain-containing protein [Hypoxylon sp. NC1633]